MNTVGNILLTLANLLALVNLAQAGIGTPEDLLSRAQRGLTQSAGSSKRQSVSKGHKSVVISLR
jgi:hypothetical protein